ncbi:MFS transporter [Pelagibius sp.]|uniref:MFS transporter n=1 Tax=Pelagibius sp. TaxID=1931238 RepID=UPI00262660E5|nr:MFS transporter [Pelagibius sp.]
MRDNNLRLIMVFACFGHAWFHVLVALFLTLVLVLEPVWQRPYDELIGLWTLGALLLGLAAPLAGWLSDRWGEANLMVVYFLGIGIATLLCGFATGPAMLTAALGLMGLFGAIYHPVGTAWVIKHATRRGRSVAVLGISGSIGAAAASLVAAVLADLLDWRLAFVLPGLLAIFAGAALAWALATGLLRDRESDVLPTPEASRKDVRQAFAVLAVTMSLTTVVYYAFTTMLPKWLDRQVGAALGDGLLGLGALVTAVYLLGATAQLVGGYFADRGAAKRVYVLSYGLKLAALLLALSVAGWPVVAVAVVVIFVFDIAAPLESVLIARFTSSRRRGLAYGIRNGIAIAAGPLGVQLVSWLFDEAAGFDHLLLVLAGIVAVIALAAGLLPGDDSQTRPAGT